MAGADCVDLLIIGGGINGAGIARDAAGRGLSVALVEQGDLAQATSSASTKLIHGGLRYLEFFEFRLVREALIERERLLAIAPHLIRPMQFILPHVPGLRPRWQIRLGLFFYDHIGTRRKLPASRSVRITASTYGALREGIRYGFAYSDCCADDSRLVIANAMDAARRGARIHTRTRFVSAQTRDGIWHAQCLNQSTGAALQIRARSLVNAAGPWVERVLRTVPCVQTDAQVRLVKGSHVVLPRLFEGSHAFMLQNPDGRIVFAIPYERHFTLVGTTDEPYEDDPGRVGISDHETAYLCETINRYFRKPVTAQDVCWSYAGVRPLLDDEEESASKVTRDYRLELAEGRDHPPLLNIFGGKITTYRRLAEAALEKLRPHVGGSATSWTASVALPGGDLQRADFVSFLSGVRKRYAFLDEAVATRLARAYGTRIEKVLGNARAMSDLGEHYGAGLTQAELDYLVACEWAASAEDVLWRRSKLGLHLTEAQRQRVSHAFDARTAACV